MRSALASLGLIALSLVSPAVSQAVTGLIVPSSLPPAGCDNSRSGTFTITVTNVTAAAPSASKRSFDQLEPRQRSGVLTLTLVGGILHDQAGRTGYIASNYQFQFDEPPQNGAIYTGGFSLCSNGSLAIGGNAVFWQCLSGTFYNLYDRNWANTCNAVYIEAVGGAGSVYSTPPTVPASTGPSTANITNPGTPTTAGNSSAVGIGGGSTAPASVNATRSGTPSFSGLGGPTSSGSMQTSGSSASVGGSSSAAASTSSASSSGNDAPGIIAAPQTLLAWAAGLVGAVAMV